MELQNTQAPAFDDEEVRLLLAGTDRDLQQAFELVDRLLKLPLMGWAKNRCSWLRPDDLPDIWQKVMVCFFQKIAADKKAGQLDIDKPLLPLLCTIVHRRAVELLRQQRAQRKYLPEETAEDRLATAVGKSIQGTKIGEWWKNLTVLERNEFQDVMREEIAKLPRRQRLICEAYFLTFDGDISYEDLATEVSALTGRPETVVAVKGSVREGRKKVAAALEKRGFSLGGQNEP